MIVKNVLYIAIAIAKHEISYRSDIRNKCFKHMILLEYVVYFKKYSSFIDIYNLKKTWRLVF